MSDLSISITLIIIFPKHKSKLWVYLQLWALTTTSQVWLTKLDALYSWSMLQTVTNWTFTKSSSVLQISKLLLRLLDLWCKIIFWAVLSWLKTQGLGSMVLRPLSLILYLKEISMLEMWRIWITLLLPYSTSRLTRLISLICGSTVVPVTPIR